MMDEGRRKKHFLRRNFGTLNFEADLLGNQFLNFGPHNLSLPDRRPFTSPAGSYNCTVSQMKNGVRLSPDAVA